MNLEVPSGRGLYLRTRCVRTGTASQVICFGWAFAAHEVGFDSMFMLVWRGSVNLSWIF